MEARDKYIVIFDTKKIFHLKSFTIFSLKAMDPDLESEFT